MGAPASALAWAYEGASGPDAWASLKPEYAQCGQGRRQSPLNLQDGIAVDLEPIAFRYQASSFAVIDTGRTVEVRLANGNEIEVLGRRFALRHIQFHRPSEERVDGRVYDMSIQLVHADEKGRFAVVVLLVEQGPPHAAVQTVWNNLPLEKGEEWPARVLLDPAALLPESRGYFSYMGSLTAPPCTEGVLRLVMKTPIALSADQLGIFSRLYAMNARPIQDPAGRMIPRMQSPGLAHRHGGVAAEAIPLAS